MLKDMNTIRLKCIVCIEVMEIVNKPVIPLFHRTGSERHRHTKHQGYQVQQACPSVEQGKYIDSKCFYIDINQPKFGKS